MTKQICLLNCSGYFKLIGRVNRGRYPRHNTALLRLEDHVASIHQVQNLACRQKWAHDRLPELQKREYVQETPQTTQGTAKDSSDMTF